MRPTVAQSNSMNRASILDYWCSRQLEQSVIYNWDLLIGLSGANATVCASCTKERHFQHLRFQNTRTHAVLLTLPTMKAYYLPSLICISQSIEWHVYWRAWVCLGLSVDSSYKAKEDFVIGHFRNFRTSVTLTLDRVKRHIVKFR